MNSTKTESTQKLKDEKQRICCKKKLRANNNEYAVSRAQEEQRKIEESKNQTSAS